MGKEGTRAVKKCCGVIPDEVKQPVPGETLEKSKIVQVVSYLLFSIKNVLNCRQLRHETLDKYSLLH